MTFTDLNILPELETALVKENIVAPTPIQEKAVPVVANNKNAYISSETGTGKTLAYLLPLLSKIDAESKALQIIILTPTHELSSQIQDQLIRLKQNSAIDFRSQLLIGSGSAKRQLEKLKKKPHIVVGSTGRILEFIKIRKLKVHTVKSIVIDEADKMLFDENIGLIYGIIRSLPKFHQKIFVSATNQPKSNKIAVEMSSDKITEVHVGSNQIAGNIEHIYFLARESEKPEMLRKIINAYNSKHAIVFTHRNETAKKIAAHLKANGIIAGEIHGSCDKHERVKAINQFRKGIINVLVASDMAARGLDVKGVTHIINFDIPGQSKNYLHRAGRTGRAGEYGCCVSLVTPEEKSVVLRYERELKIKMNEKSISK